MRALITGWFSFAWMGATAGDLLAAEVVRSWLDEIGCPYDVALAPTVGDGVDALSVDPLKYTHVVFVCGPLGQGEPVTTLFERFGHARLIGLDVSMLAPLEDWNPFDLLLERDSSRAARPDLALLADPAIPPLIGLVLVHEQKEYAAGRHPEVHAMIRSVLAQLDAAVVPVDTCFDPPNETGLRTPGQVLAVMGRMDAIVTTRLHGLVLGLKCGVPVVAVDPVAGGAKISRQAEALGWEIVLQADEVSPDALSAALETCLQPTSRRRAMECAARAGASLQSVRDRFLSEIAGVR